MEIEKAIKELKMENELMQFSPTTGETYPIKLQNQDNQDLYSANLVAIEALEKQAPKKPICEYDDEFTCPCCGTTTEAYDVTTLKRCPECGQALRWIND